MQLLNYNISLIQINQKKIVPKKILKKRLSNSSDL